MCEDKTAGEGSGLTDEQIKTKASQVGGDSLPPGHPGEEGRPTFETHVDLGHIPNYEFPYVHKYRPDHPPVNRPDGQAESGPLPEVALIDLDSREFLQGLRQAAERNAAKVVNAHWCRKFLALAEAADSLDALVARSEVSLAETPKVEHIARAAHGALRGYCKFTGGHNERSWKDSSPEHKEALIHGVVLVMNDPNVTVLELHDDWRARKRAAGWKYDPVHSEEHKLSPCIQRFGDLPPVYRAKQYIFLAAVLEMLE